MKPYTTYVSELQQLILQVQSADDCGPLEASITANLNGRASRELRRLIDISELRSNGAFFTSTQLSTLLLGAFHGTLTSASRILDPACGAGDLLLACARELVEVEGEGCTDLPWIEQLHGRDLHQEFISAASARLSLAALTMKGQVRSQKAKLSGECNAQLQASCGLTDTDAIKQASHIVLNPPFTVVDSPVGCSWAEGKVNLAAVFVDNCLRHAAPGTRLAAVLPDVLRSGSRYERWRQAVERRAVVDNISIYGKFDGQTDVDVFILSVTAGLPHPAETPVCWLDSAIKSSMVADYFDVCVGPVVQYRDPHSGPWTPYARAGNTPAWVTLEHFEQKRQWSGKTIAPPFIAVRRTSSPGDAWRAPSTLILGETPIAVDNHLLILKPKTGGVDICKMLLAQLRSNTTNDWLNHRIRCRHLTVSAIKELPFEA